MTPSSPEPSHSALPELVQSPPEIPRDPFSPYQKIPNLQNRVPGWDPEAPCLTRVVAHFWSRLRTRSQHCQNQFLGQLSPKSASQVFNLRFWGLLPPASRRDNFCPHLQPGFQDMEVLVLFLHTLRPCSQSSLNRAPAIAFTNTCKWVGRQRILTGVRLLGHTFFPTTLDRVLGFHGDLFFCGSILHTYRYIYIYV
jgi:hypothetical protein